jgi:hypothetical protein
VYLRRQARRHPEKRCETKVTDLAQNFGRIKFEENEIPSKDSVRVG